MTKQERVLKWLHRGETGMSSECIAFCALGRPQERVSHPYDPADFYRCMVLIYEVPEIVADDFDAIAGLSPEWNAIIENYDELKELLMAEVGLEREHGTSAPKTYKRMQDVLGEARTEKRGA